MDDFDTYTAFVGDRRIASGSLSNLLQTAKAHVERISEEKTGENLLIFHDQTGKQTDFDFRGSIQDVLDRALPKPARIGPGRPRLGVVSREVSLLPRHWAWLEAQPSGASAALRRLVDDARKRDSGESAARQRIEAAGRVMTVMAGNQPGFEEAYRALYARDFDRLQRQISGWPLDLCVYLTERVAILVPDQPAAQ